MSKMLPYAAFLLLVSQGKYAFNDDGRAVRMTSGNVVSRHNRNGYRRIPFTFCGKRYEIMEHVAYFILGSGQWPRKGQQVNHKDLDRSNGRFNNLELMSQSQNLKHAHAMRKAGHVGGKR